MSPEDEHRVREIVAEVLLERDRQFVAALLDPMEGLAAAMAPLLARRQDIEDGGAR